MDKAVQEYFDKWSIPITGGTVDVETSSHGKAFIAGWKAAMEYLKNGNVTGTLHQ